MVAVLCSLALVPSTITPTLAQDAAPSPSAPQQASGAGTEQRPDAQPSAKVPDEQIDSLVAPIALYPDPLLAQVLAASTYPLEVVELQQWLGQHADLKGEALVEAVKKMDWDPSVQGLAAVPDAVKLLASNIKWTTDLGNVFLAQEADVMAAVQRMRVKAKDKGALKSNEQMKVETKEVDDQTVVVIQQADPQVVYVPTYSPTVVYGPAPAHYGYPYYAYPPGYVAGTAMISFGIGVAMGAAFSGGWGYSCGWGGGHNTYVNVNRNNTFVRNSSSVRTGGRGGTSGRWEHNPRHRGGAPYRDRATADRFGGRNASPGRRSDNRGRQDVGGRRMDAPNRQRADYARGGDRGLSTSANQIGDRRAAPSAGSGLETRGQAFNGGKQGGYSGSSARSSSARGSASMGHRGGGGGRGGGPRGGGGGRGGGGRR